MYTVICWKAQKMSRSIKDKELKEYQNQIGVKEYSKQYHKIYNLSKITNKRFSGKDYENSEERLNEIKEKYKNGVTKEILDEMLR